MNTYQLASSGVLFLLVIVFRFDFKTYLTPYHMATALNGITNSSHVPMSNMNLSHQRTEASFTLNSKVPPFQEDVTDCSNQIVEDEHDLSAYINRFNHEKRPCTMRLFQENSAKNVYYKGVWFMPNASLPETAQFYPENCFFLKSKISPSLCKSKVNKILVTGDSNGWQYFLGLLKVIRELGWRCTVERKENTFGKLKDKDYFITPGVSVSKLQVAGRGCSTCISKVYHCHKGRGKKGSTKENFVPKFTNSLQLEYIGMIHFIDSTLRLTYDMAGAFENRLYSADTFLEYLLKYYFAHHGFPDFWILSSPIHHEAWGSSLAKFKVDLIYFLHLLDLYWPSSSDIMILPDIRECPKMVPDDANRLIKMALNMTRNEKIHAMNQILYDVFQPRFSSSWSNIHGFLDLGQITCPVSCSWHRDGGHMRDFWYPKIIAYILQLFCL